ncbi:hypothetical protein J0S82_000682 [Galemys pyrenaicus]|uniref:Galactosyltransferase N-terminal domain-containing protein n=1 Tax=Galemys pyrenaicus TaxID=202257 RepID=A0A8J6A5X3_GALPY|nr:hypothetical protein J0S82_000682 [Galemys pyrenaicus]
MTVSLHMYTDGRGDLQALSHAAALMATGSQRMELRLHLLPYHPHPCLQRQQLAYGIDVLYQAENGTFNRAVEWEPRGHSICCHHEQAWYSLLYLHYYGGLWALTPDQYLKMNRFTDECWGWDGLKLSHPMSLAQGPVLPQSPPELSRQNLFHCLIALAFIYLLLELSEPQPLGLPEAANRGCCPCNPSGLPGGAAGGSGGDHRQRSQPPARAADWEVSPEGGRRGVGDPGERGSQALNPPEGCRSKTLVRRQRWCRWGLGRWLRCSISPRFVRWGAEARDLKLQPPPPLEGALVEE